MKQVRENKMRYHFKIHKDDDGLWAECLELKGCATQGDTMEELKENMEEALNLYLEEPLDSAAEDPLPDDKMKESKSVVAVPVQPAIALSVMLRHYRTKNKLTQAEMMKILNMKNIYSYQRLEKKTDPKLSTIAKIKEAIPELSIDYILQR